MIPRRSFVSSCFVGGAIVGVAGCLTGSEDETEHEPQSGGHDLNYPVLAESYIDERRPFDAHIYYHEEDDFERDVLHEEMDVDRIPIIMRQVEMERDIFFFHSRVDFNEDATTGNPYDVSYHQNRTEIELRSDGQYDAPAWNGPDSWSAESGTTDFRAYEKLPRGAGDSFEITHTI